MNVTTSSPLLELAHAHECARHPLFAELRTRKLTQQQAAKLLRNYDAHASVLRRLLLKAATLMPEPAVGFVLENVRNEYGNGDYLKNHQFQLQDVAWQMGADKEEYAAFPVMPGVRAFIDRVEEFYFPPSNTLPDGFNRAAVSAGAITATEILAIEEFRALQIAFTQFGLEHHIWFHHVTIEEEHSDESVALANYFIGHHSANEAVAHGMNGVLNANVHLYDGLLAAIS